VVVGGEVAMAVGGERVGLSFQMTTGERGQQSIRWKR
jgi:hypothetical protein